MIMTLVYHSPQLNATLTRMMPVCLRSRRQPAFVIVPDMRIRPEKFWLMFWTFRSSGLFTSATPYFGFSRYRGQGSSGSFKGDCAFFEANLKQ